MDPLEIILALVAAVTVAVIGVVAWQRRRLALPPQPERDALPAALRDAEGHPAVDRPPLPVPADGKPPTVDLGSMRFEPPPLPGQTRPPVEKPTVRSEQERLREGLAKTRGGFVAKLARLFRGRTEVGADLRDQIEEVLFTADIGTTTAQHLLERVEEVLDRDGAADADTVWRVILDASREIIDLPAPAPETQPAVKPYVLLMIGVNGVGKTTTLGKLAAKHVADGRKVLLVAGDTFRAAAVEQLEVWAGRVGATLHRGADKADPSSVIYEGIVRGAKEGFDVVLCDTAGRLHTRKELMDELGKVRRSAAKALSHRSGVTVDGPHDTWLVLDATIGQNALSQAKLFKETMDFTGLVVTKLDGTAKGGVVLGICDEMKIPIRYVGVGERVDDLREFDASAFVNALFADRDQAGGPSDGSQGSSA